MIYPCQLELFPFRVLASSEGRVGLSWGDRAKFGCRVMLSRLAKLSQQLSFSSLPPRRGIQVPALALSGSRPFRQNLPPASPATMYVFRGVAFLDLAILGAGTTTTTPGTGTTVPTEPIEIQKIAPVAPRGMHVS